MSDRHRIKVFYAGFAVVVLLVTSTQVLSNERPLSKRVAIIHSYIPGEWYHGLNKGFEETLGKLGVVFELTPILYDSEFWQNKSVGEKQRERARIISQLKTFRPDLVVVCDDEAADFLIVEISRSGFPIVFTAVNQPLEDLTWLKEVPRSSITGVLEEYPAGKFIDVLEKLLPNLKTISILSSRKPTSQAICASTEKEMNSEEFRKRHKIRLRNVNMRSHWEEWKELIPSLNVKDNAVWVLVPYDVRDSNNMQVPLPQMGRWFRKHLKIPYIGMSVVHTKMGGLMSVQITPYDLARQAAELAEKFFRGARLDKLPIEKARFHQIEINITEAKRLGIKIPKELLGVATLVEEPYLKYGR